METNYDKLTEEVQELAVIGSIGSVLGWDRNVNMPPKGNMLRAQ